MPLLVEFAEGTVGFAVAPQTTPRDVTGSPPSSVTSPPALAWVVVIEVAGALVLTTGAVVLGPVGLTVPFTLMSSPAPSPIPPEPAADSAQP